MKAKFVILCLIFWGFGDLSFGAEPELPVNKTPEYVFLECPCTPKNTSCDFGCCYCDLKCKSKVPISVITGEKWLANRQEDSCTNPKLPHFETQLPSDRFYEAFEDINWKCGHENTQINLIKKWFFLICIAQDNLRPLGPQYSWNYILRSKLSRTIRQIEASGRKSNKAYFSWEKKIKEQQAFQESKNSKSKRRERQIGKVVGQKKLIFQATQKIQKKRKVIKSKNFGKYSFIIQGGEPCYRRKAGLNYKGVDSTFRCIIQIVLAKKKKSKITCNVVRTLLDEATKTIFHIQFPHQDKLCTRSECLNHKLSKDKNVTVLHNQKLAPTNETGTICENVTMGFSFTMTFLNNKIISSNYETYSTNLSSLDSMKYILRFSTHSVKADGAKFSRMSRFWYNFSNDPCQYGSCWRESLQIPRFIMKPDNMGKDLACFLFATIFAIWVALSVEDLFKLDS